MKEVVALTPLRTPVDVEGTAEGAPAAAMACSALRSAFEARVARGARGDLGERGERCCRGDRDCRGALGGRGYAISAEAIVAFILSNSVGLFRSLLRVGLILGAVGLR